MRSYDGPPRLFQGWGAEDGRDRLPRGQREGGKAGSELASPPFAVDELDFLLACTRCDKCIEACPHDVLFKLPARTGLQAAGTPAMDLLNRGCHLCRDWPCVAACEPDA